MIFLIFRREAYQINNKSPNIDRGELELIQKLVAVLPNGLKLKQEVRTYR